MLELAKQRASFFLALHDSRLLLRPARLGLTQQLLQLFDVAALTKKLFVHALAIVRLALEHLAKRHALRLAVVQLLLQIVSLALLGVEQLLQALRSTLLLVELAFRLGARASLALERELVIDLHPGLGVPIARARRQQRPLPNAILHPDVIDDSRASREHGLRVRRRPRATAHQVRRLRAHVLVRPPPRGFDQFHDV